MGLWLHRLAAAFVLAFEALACLASVILLMLLSAAPLYRDALLETAFVGLLYSRLGQRRGCLP
jgi:hypothetical protein